MEPDIRTIQNADLEMCLFVPKTGVWTDKTAAISRQLCDTYLGGATPVVISSQEQNDLYLGKKKEIERVSK